MAKFKVSWTDFNHPEPLWEEMDYPEVVDQATAEAKAHAVMLEFNETEQARYGEKGRPRTVIAVEFIGGLGKRDHKWHKKNLVTVAGPGGSIYDEYECEVCGAQSRRFTLDGGFTLIGVYQRYRDKYRYCPGDEE